MGIDLTGGVAGAAVEGLLDIGKGLISRIWPDPKEQAEQLFKLQELEQKGDLAELQAHVTLLQGQLAINLEDAKSGNFFQSGWRPSIGWVGSLSLALMVIPKALVMTYIWSYQNIVLLENWDGVKAITITPFPDLGTGDVIALLGSMLGVAAMRSFDKKQKTDTK